MASVDEDLRHGPASVRPFGHLAPPRRIGIHVDLLEGDALRFEQALRPMAIRAEHARVDFDPGNPESHSRLRYSQIYGALTTRSTRRRRIAADPGCPVSEFRRSEDVIVGQRCDST